MLGNGRGHCGIPLLPERLQSTNVKARSAALPCALLSTQSVFLSLAIAMMSTRFHEPKKSQEILDEHGFVASTTNCDKKQNAGYSASSVSLLLWEGPHRARFVEGDIHADTTLRVTQMLEFIRAIVHE